MTLTHALSTTWLARRIHSNVNLAPPLGYLFLADRALGSFTARSVLYGRCREGLCKSDNVVPSCVWLSRSGGYAEIQILAVRDGNEMGNWTTEVRRLLDHLHQSEARLSFVQTIDQAILASEVSVDQLLDIVVNELQSLCGVPRVSVYLNSGAHLNLLTATHAAQPRTLPRPPLSSTVSSPGQTYLIDTDRSLLDPLGAESILAAPLYGRGSYPIALLIVESHYPSQLHHLSDPGIVDFVSAICKQLSLAIEFKEERRSETLRWRIVQQILENDKPGVAFSIVCSSLIDFLPPFRATAIIPAPQRQILLHTTPDEFLTIVATTGPEAVNTRVLVNHSTTGRLILSRDEFINIDPTVDSLYCPYLGTQMRSELAIRMQLSERVTAIFNLEAESENAFGEIHVKALRLAACELTPILARLQSMRERSLMKQRALLYALDNHLELVTVAFSHDVAGLLSNARLLIDEIAASVAESALPAKLAAAKLSDQIKSVEAYRKQLVADIVGFSHNARRSVAGLMRSAIQLIRPDTLRARNIVVSSDFDEHAEVYCSLFLKEIFTNLLNNAKYWVEARQIEENNHAGSIQITISREEREDALGRRDPGINQKVRIVVRDNGVGMPTDQLTLVFERDFTRRKEGTGFGLFAAKEYITSIGGEIHVATQESNYFEVTILLDEYHSSRLADNESGAVFNDDAAMRHPLPPGAVPAGKRRNT